MIAASVKRPPYGSGGVNPRDPDARVTVKRKTVHFGYKAHLAVDEVSGLVRQAEMTPANVHDSRLADALIQGDEQGYFASQRRSPAPSPGPHPARLRANLKAKRRANDGFLRAQRPPGSLSIQRQAAPC